MLMWLLLGCSRAPIEDLWEHNGMVQIKDLFTSVVFIEEYKLLIDTGFNEKSKSIQQYLETQHLSLDDIQYVVYTHSHEDHCAGLDNFPNADVYIHANAVDAFADMNITADHLFSDSFWIEDLEIRPYEMLGHIDGNVALQIRDVLMMGDSAQSNKDGTIETVSAKFSEDPALTATELASLHERLDDPDSISWMVFSHSGPIEGTQALEQYQAE